MARVHHWAVHPLRSEFWGLSLLLKPSPSASSEPQEKCQMPSRKNAHNFAHFITGFVGYPLPKALSPMAPRLGTRIRPQWQSGGPERPNGTRKNAQQSAGGAEVRFANPGETRSPLSHDRGHKCGQSFAKLTSPLTPLMNHKILGLGRREVSDLPVAFGGNQLCQLFQRFLWPVLLAGSTRNSVFKWGGGCGGPPHRAPISPGDPARELRTHIHTWMKATVTTISTA